MLHVIVYSDRLFNRKSINLHTYYLLLGFPVACDKSMAIKTEAIEAIMII